MKRGSKTSKAKPKTKKKEISSSDSSEEDDWSAPVVVYDNTRPKKLHYNLDDLLRENEKTPLAEKKKEEVEVVQQPDATKNMTTSDVVDELAAEGFSNAAEVHRILHFDEDWKKLNPSMVVLQNPYKRPSTIPFPEIDLTRGSPQKQQQPRNRLFQFLAEAEIPKIDLVLDCSAFVSLFQSVKYVHLSDRELSACRHILQWLLRVVAHHPQHTIAASAFRILCSLLTDTHCVDAFIPYSIPSKPFKHTTSPQAPQPPQVSQPLQSSQSPQSSPPRQPLQPISEGSPLKTPRKRARSPQKATLELETSRKGVCWLHLLPPGDFHSIWELYGATFNSLKANNNDDNSKSDDFPITNFTLVTQILHICTEMEAPLFLDAIPSFLPQVLQFMLDPTASTAPTLSPLFESLLCTYLSLPPTSSISSPYTKDQIAKLHSLVQTCAQLSTHMRVRVCIAETIPLGTPPARLLRASLSLVFLEQILQENRKRAQEKDKDKERGDEEEIKVPPPPTQYDEYANQIIKFYSQCLSLPTFTEQELLSTIQLIGYSLSCDLTLLRKYKKDTAELTSRLRKLSSRVKECGLFTPAKTRMKSLIAELIGLLSLLD